MRNYFERFVGEGGGDVRVCVCVCVCTYCIPCTISGALKRFLYVFLCLFVCFISFLIVLYGGRERLLLVCIVYVCICRLILSFFFFSHQAAAAKNVKG